MMCIDTLHMLPVRRRTRGTEEIEEIWKQEDEETKRRRNEPLQLKLSGEKINGLLRGSRVIFFFDPPWRRGFQHLSQVRDDFVCAFFFDARNIFILIPSQYFFLMRHPILCQKFLCSILGGKPLHAASRGGHPDVAQLLLGAGADLEAEDNGGPCDNAWKWKDTYHYCIIYSLLIYAISWRYDSIHMFFCATKT